VRVSGPVWANVSASDGDVVSRYAQVSLADGLNRLAGLDEDISIALSAPADAELCAIEAGAATQD
jgi:hypothetical protein